ncbi:toll/interleukin-1 receptor domain-containing protein [Streptomyces coacervatus]|uniref:Toll/interleukin-1 receptor domain-containing protein n=1 Tax=Streptomyces coacervatus TaxID=647381 RepID=A0ABP7JAR3_9ACTN|nr:toll/interleukin-1 receptor domain-containing protein [Streptomyces coacervatus]MDF2273381.1 toll/interleukin-1 receptor domain-containing protein [Streptomyces coacervatus]
MEPDAAKPPGAFLSHASEDKPGFVEPLARELLSRGVAAWLDKWEIRPGDSLVRRLFDEGIAMADAVVAVVSQHSVDKPWVREELDAAAVARVNGESLLIPVRLDEVPMPAPLKPLLWITADRTPEGVVHTAQQIADTLHGYNPRPAVGPLPAYARVGAVVLSLNTADTVLLTETIREALRTNEMMLLNWAAVKSRAKDAGLSDERVEESLHMLGEQEYVDVTLRASGAHDYHLTRKGYRAGISTVLPKVEEHRRAVIAELVNDQPMGSTVIDDLAARTETPPLVVEQILNDLQDQGKLSYRRYMGNSSKLHSVSPTLRRLLD